MSVDRRSALVRRRTARTSFRQRQSPTEELSDVSFGKVAHQDVAAVGFHHERFTVGVEAPNFERTTLERKDRAELVQISEALGKKPASRAKKADIVEGILELAGVIPGGADGGEPRVADAKPEDGAETAATSKPAPATAPAPETPDTSAPAGRGASKKNGASGPDAKSAESADDQTDDASASQGNGGNDEDDELESANKRRRRRRGRERERNDETAEWDSEPVEVSGLLDLRDDGYGFLRVRGFLPSRDDVYVSVKQCRQLGLRRGDHVAGVARPPGRQERNPAMVRIEAVNGIEPDNARDRVVFDDLTAVHPDTQLTLAVSSADGHETDVAGAVVDILAPVGRGQRVLISVPPLSGGPAFLRSLAHAVEQNHPDVHLIVVMVNERPEEVTDMRRSLESGEVVASTFDRPAEEHALVVELAVEHAKRLVEYGNDVVVVLDGLSKLSRAHNMAGSTGGRTLQGGLESGAIAPGKRVFGAARKAEEGGSLTIFATAAIETGSVVDGIVHDEFLPTASSIIRLDRHLAAEDVAPAIDFEGTETVRADLIVGGDGIAARESLRESLASEGTGSQSPTALLIEKIRKAGSVDAVLGS